MLWMTALIGTGYAGECPALCAKMLDCVGVDDAAEQAACVASCSATGPDPRVARAVLAAHTCDDVVSALSGGAPPAAAPAPRPAAPSPRSEGGTCGEPNATADRQLFTTLTANRWCGFSYTGSTERRAWLTLGANGVLTVTDHAETVRTGQTVNSLGEVTQNHGAWGSDGGNGTYQWRLRGTTLEATSDCAQWVAVPYQLTRNSNGYPILTIRGMDFSQC